MLISIILFASISGTTYFLWKKSKEVTLQELTAGEATTFLKNWFPKVRGGLLAISMAAISFGVAKFTGLNITAETAADSLKQVDLIQAALLEIIGAIGAIAALLKPEVEILK